MKKKIITALLLLVCIQTAVAQFVVINYNSGKKERRNIATIESITFEKEVSSSVSGWVDLELPSGTLWAACNLGAETPEEIGDYFAWGETEDKIGYYWSNYKFCINGNEKWLTKYVLDPGWSYTGDPDWKNELEPEDDAATFNLGSRWRMPSLAQQDELFDSSNTTQEWTTSNGISGLLITSVRNGKNIFLPATGFWWNGELVATDAGYYASRTLDSELDTDAWFMCADRKPSNCGTISGSRSFGRPVRPVCVDPEYVDLGLPSGTLWATRNVGADSPLGRGDFFSWGEVSSKSTYNGSNYEYESKYDYMNELDAEDDAASVNWGDDWQMPSVEQVEELVNFEYTTNRLTTIDGVYGTMITSKINGKSIFFPATGYYSGENEDGNVILAPDKGMYWTRNRSNVSVRYAVHFVFDGGGTYGDTYRCGARAVRPVRRQ